MENSSAYAVIAAGAQSAAMERESNTVAMVAVGVHIANMDAPSIHAENAAGRASAFTASGKSCVDLDVVAFLSVSTAKKSHTATTDAAELSFASMGEGTTSVAFAIWMDLCGKRVPAG